MTVVVITMRRLKKMQKTTANKQVYVVKTRDRKQKKNALTSTGLVLVINRARRNS
jgi:hypothetical protein